MKSFFAKMDKKIDEKLFGSTEKRTAKTQIGWFFHYGLKPDEVPERIKQNLSEEEFTRLVNRYF